MAEDAVNWNEYFCSIGSVCPWSLRSWRKGAIAITIWHGIITPLGSWEARLYLAPKHNPRQLKKMADRFNRTRPQEEWLWSHPQYQHHSTPVACFIQQDRKTLEMIRLNMKNKTIDK